MSPPMPVRGLVVRHAFLWSHEQAAGKAEGSKDRPAVVILVMAADTSGNVRVGVVPITHAPPEEADGAIAVPNDVKTQLGLDAAPQWIVLDEINRFVWPGYDLRDVPRTGGDSYGMLPRALFDRVLVGVLARHRARKTSVVDRD